MGRIRDYLLGRSPPDSPGATSLVRSEVFERAELAEVDGLFDIVIPNWYQQNLGVGSAEYGNARLAERVWVANALPADERAADRVDAARVPRGTSRPSRRGSSNPDPEWFPNGIGDAIHAIVDQMYGWGFVAAVRDRLLRRRVPAHVDGARLVAFDVDAWMASRVYRDRRRRARPASVVVQIDRNPGVRRTGRRRCARTGRWRSG
jgi:hypothetical protein